MTVVYSVKNGSKYRQVGSGNVLTADDNFLRTFPDIMAPGEGVLLASGNNTTTSTPSGTSFAAPHVTGTAALLHEHARNQGWGANARRHEVMKAVIMNSADKIEDNGTFAAPGDLLGMQRTALKKDGVSTWFDSPAYLDGRDDNGGFISLDDEMGVGHLNAERAFVQYAPGERNPNGGANIPPIGWDYDTTGGVGFAGINRYEFSTELSGDSFVSITLAWDREVTFSPGDGPTYEADDTFVDYTTTDDPFGPPANSVVNRLVLWLLPAGAATTAEAIATSDANEGSLQHIFFQLPSTGQYEFWVEQRTDDVSTTQDYAVAWWTKSATLLAQGDFNNDGMVDGADLAQWEGDFGINDDSDANDDGVSDGTDFLIWQRNFGLAGAATPTAGAVPEPAACLLVIVCVPFIARRRVS